MRAWLLACLLGFGVCLTSLAQSVLPVPSLNARVIDQTATLTTEQVQALSSQLKKLEDERGAQVVVLMVATTQPEDIFSYSIRVANEWKIGRKSVGDGILIVVAKNDRKLRIEIAKSLEGAVPDVLAGQIITEIIAPQLKQGLYAQGIERGLIELDHRIASEGLPAASNQSSVTDPPDLFFNVIAMFFFAFFSVPVLGGIATALFGKKLAIGVVGIGAGTLGWFMTYSLIVAAGAGCIAIAFTALANIKGLGRSSGNTNHWNSGYGSGGLSSGGFSSSSGGFSSGGGGSFGGGGASGDW